MLSYAAQILEQSFLMFPLVLGIYISFTILKIADLTVDGSLVLGACIFAKLSSTGTHWLIAMLVAILGGALSGITVALVQRHNRVDPLIAGILMAFILNSLSLIIMQRPNIGLMANDGLFDAVARFVPISISATRIFTLFVFVIALGLGAVAFLRSKAGMWLKAFGNNEGLVAMLGKDPECLRITGLSLSNALAALTGCLGAQASGYADINMGFGQALIGIAMILVGRQLFILFKKHNASHDIVAILFTLLGIILYFVLTNEVIRYGLSPIYLKMAIGGLLIIFLWVASDQATHARSSTP